MQTYRLCSLVDCRLTLIICAAHISSHMIQKLFALVRGDIVDDNPDAVSNQELWLPGQLYLAIFKEKLQEWLSSVCAQVSKVVREGKVTDFDNGMHNQRDWEIIAFEYELTHLDCVCGNRKLLQEMHGALS
jgi:DNA-directed RNA polymerase beta subunit